MPTAPPTRRRWFQFGLGSLLALVTVFAVWLGWHMNRVHAQRALVGRVNERGRNVTYDIQIQKRDGKSPYPDWIVQALGIDFLHRVTVVFLHDIEFNDQDLLLVSHVPSIECLSLVDAQISNDGMKHLSRLKHLRSLELKVPGIDDDGLKYLACHTKLQELWLTRTNVTNDGLVYLRDMTELKSLVLDDTRITDAAIKHLKQLKNLNFISVSRTQISPEGIEELKAALPNAEIIKLY